MTIQLTAAQVKMMTPKLKKEIAFENKWRSTHTGYLFVRENDKQAWSKLCERTFASERERVKLKEFLQSQAAQWNMTYYRGHQFKIVIADSVK